MDSAALRENDAEKTPEFPIPAGCFAERVTSVKHYTDNLFAFRITRPQSDLSLIDSPTLFSRS